MFDWFNNILATWQYIFINGFIDYLGVNFTGPLIERTLGPMGAYISSGLTFTAKQAAQGVSYFSGLGGSLGGMFSRPAAMNGGPVR